MKLKEFFKRLGYTPLSKKHAKFRWQTPQDFGFKAKIPKAPVIMGEIDKTEGTVTNQSFFTVQGEPSPALTRVLEFLQRYEHHRELLH